MAERGRPRDRMTTRRQQVFDAYVDEITAGGRVHLARIARRCGLTDYRNARRILADLHRLGRIPG